MREFHPLDAWLCGGFLAVVILTQWGYHWIEGGPPCEAWTLYVMRGVQSVYAAFLLWRYRPRSGPLLPLAFLALACAALVWEESQNAICGLAEWKQPAYVGDLCVHRFGKWPYIILAGLCGLRVAWYLWSGKDSGE